MPFVDCRISAIKEFQERTAKRRKKTLTPSATPLIDVWMVSISCVDKTNHIIVRKNFDRQGLMISHHARK